MLAPSHPGNIPRARALEVHSAASIDCTGKFPPPLAKVVFKRFFNLLAIPEKSLFPASQVQGVVNEVAD